jgi:hypothetical protein
MDAVPPKRRTWTMERRMDVILGVIATGVLGVILSNLLS